MKMTGGLSILHDTITIKTNTYRILSLSGDLIVLDDLFDKIYTLSKTDKPYPPEPAALATVAPENLIGNWKTDQHNRELLIKDRYINRLHITGKNGDGSLSGVIEYGDWSANKFMSQPFILTLSGSIYKIALTQDPNVFWSGVFQEGAKNELIFKTNGRTLFTFLKQAPSPSPTAIVDTAKCKIDIDPDSLKINWTVRRITKNKEFKGKTRISNLNITKSLSADNRRFGGSIKFSSDGNPETEKPCVITMNCTTGSGIIVSIDAESNTWYLKMVKKADGKEMVLGTPAEIQYFFRINN